MLEKIKATYELQKAKRAERKSRPWGKKQKIIFLAFLGIMVAYIAVSAVIASYGNVQEVTGQAQEVVIPTLELDINAVDVAVLCIIGGAIAVIKIRKHLKNKKEDNR